MTESYYYTLDNNPHGISDGSAKLSNNFPDDAEFNFMADRGNRMNRLMEAIFPEESIKSVQNIEVPHNTHIVSSMIRMEKPAQRLRFLIANMIDYIEDTETAVVAAKSLAELLRSKDNEESEKAAQFIHNLCKKQASRLGLASNPQIIEGLRRAIISSKNPNIISDCISSVQHISKGEQGALSLVAVNIIPVLLEFMSSNEMKRLASIVSCLDNLMHFDNQSIEIIRKSHGIERLVEQLDKNDVKFKTVVMNCLHKLTFNDPESKIVMLSCRGSEKVVQILRQFTYEKLLFSASKLLKVLSVCNDNKPVLVDIGAMEALSSLLRSGSSRLVLSCLWSIRNLSDHSSHISDMQKLLKKLIELLSSDDELVAICSLGCLCNLTSGNMENKVAFIEYGGVQAVCQLMCEQVSRQEIVEPGAAALRHVTHNNSLAQRAVDTIIQSPLLSNLCVLIHGQPDKMFPLIKAIVGLVRNLSMISPKCRRSLIDLGITNSLLEIFYRTAKGMNELAQQRNSIVSNISELSFVEGVRLEDLLELTLAALQALAKDNSAKKIMSYDQQFLQIVVQYVLVKENSVQLHRACLSVLAEMVEYADCARTIEGEGFCTRLSELIHSSNKAISTYAAIVLYVINLNKPEEYRNRLNTEIFESLQDKIANLEQEEERDSYSQSEFGSQIQLQQSKNAQNPEDKYKYYDNRAFEREVDEAPYANKPRGTPRQKQPQPFRDVEL